MSEQEQTQSVDTKIESALFLAIIALVVSVVHFTVGAWHAEQTNQRLQRLEKIVGIDEIGRRR
jgi:sensor domain CHASE-containing protein